MLTDLVSLIETIGPASQRTLVFKGTNFKDTLFDHPSPSTNTACTHLLASSMDRKGAYLANGSFLISTVCRHCSRVFQNKVDFAMCANPEYMPIAQAEVGVMVHLSSTP